MSDMNLGFGEMLFLFVIALLLFGPKKLPEIGRQLGRALGEFKKASDHFKLQIEDEVRNLEIESRKTSSPRNTVAAHYEPPDVMPPVILPPERKPEHAQERAFPHND